MKSDTQEYTGEKAYKFLRWEFPGRRGTVVSKTLIKGSAGQLNLKLAKKALQSCKNIEILRQSYIYIKGKYRNYSFL